MRKKIFIDISPFNFDQIQSLPLPFNKLILKLLKSVGRRENQFLPIYRIFSG